jgi:hypothetical protein
VTNRSAPELDLDALSALVDAATLGPWTTRVHPEGDAEVRTKADWCNVGSCSRADAIFIAASREAVPRLIEMVRELREWLRIAQERIDVLAVRAAGFPDADLAVRAEKVEAEVARLRAFPKKWRDEADEREKIWIEVNETPPDKQKAAIIMLRSLADEIDAALGPAVNA